MNGLEHGGQLVMYAGKFITQNSFKAHKIRRNKSERALGASYTYTQTHSRIHNVQCNFKFIGYRKTLDWHLHQPSQLLKCQLIQVCSRNLDEQANFAYRISPSIKHRNSFHSKGSTRNTVMAPSLSLALCFPTSSFATIAWPFASVLPSIPFLAFWIVAFIQTENIIVCRSSSICSRHLIPNYYATFSIIIYGHINFTKNFNKNSRIFT